MARKAASAEAPVDASTPAGAGEPALNLSYEQALSELEQLVARMEAGSLPLDQLLTAYQRGATLLGFCRSRLEAVEAQVKVLEDGQLQPWNDA